MVVVPGDVGVLGRHLGDGAVPQVAGEGQHVRLVHQREAVAAPAGQLEGEAHAALGTHAGVHRALGRHLVRGPLAQEPALAGVGPLGVLPDHHEVGPLGDGSGHPVERPQVDVEVELEAQLEQEAPLERARRDGGVADRRPDGTEQDGVVAPELLERLVRQDGAVPQVAGGPEVELGGVEVHPGRGHHLERLGADLRPDAVAADDGDPMPAGLVHSCGPFVVLLVCCRRVSPAARCLGATRPGIEKPPTQWTVRRRAGRVRA